MRWSAVLGLVLLAVPCHAQTARLTATTRADTATAATGAVGYPVVFDSSRVQWRLCVQTRTKGVQSTLKCAQAYTPWLAKAQVSPPPPAPTLLGLVIGPKVVPLVPGETQFFILAPTWSDGAVRAITPSWSATGGTMSGAIYTAGATAGTFRVIGSANGKADTATVTITGPVPTPPPPMPNPTPGPTAMFFNSAEAGCGSDPNTLMCDDFERGSWYSKDCDQANASGGLLQTGGWCGTIYANPITPAGAAACGAKGFRSNCAATSGYHTGAIGGRNMASHGFTQTGLTEASFRLYFQPQADYTGGHEKMFDFERGVGSGQMIALCYNVFSSQTISCIPYLHQDGGLLGNPGGAWMPPNVAPNVTLQRTHWYFIEMHLKLNTPGSFDGLFEWWLDDCGVDGLACTGTPTLRARYPTVLFRSAAESSVTIGSLWIENWANAATVGTMLYDNVRAAKVGPIGFTR